jgi:hypothetical protein
VAAVEGNAHGLRQALSHTLQHCKFFLEKPGKSVDSRLFEHVETPTVQLKPGQMGICRNHPSSDVLADFCFAGHGRLKTENGGKA